MVSTAILLYCVIKPFFVDNNGIEVNKKAIVDI